MISTDLDSDAGFLQVNKYSKTDYAEEPTLLFEFIGTEQGALCGCQTARRVSGT